MYRYQKYLVAIFIVFVSFGCSEPSLKDASYGINAKPALWKVEKRHKTLYLLGSIHKLPKELKWYSPKIQKAYTTSNQLIVESLIDRDPDRMAILQKKYGFLPNGKIISQFLTKDEYKRYQDIVRELDINIIYANRLRPWLFFSILQNKILPKELKNGIDILFMKQARKDRKKTFALETTQEALKALSLVPLDEGIQDLKKFLNAKKLTKDEIKDRVDLFVSWANGDTERMAYLISKNFSEKKYKYLIVERNKLWYRRMLKYFMRAKSTMLVVGAAHLTGKDSLISRLKRNGYKVTRVQ